MGLALILRPGYRSSTSEIKVCMWHVARGMWLVARGMWLVAGVGEGHGQTRGGEHEEDDWSVMVSTTQGWK